MSWFGEDITSLNWEYQNPSKGTSSNTAFFDSHLNSPITNDDPLFLLRYEEFYCRRHRIIKSLLIEENIAHDIYSLCTDPWTCIERELTIDDPARRSCKLDRIIEVCSRQLYLSRSHYVSTLDTDMSECPDFCSITNHHDYSHIKGLYTLKVKSESIKNKFCARETHFSKFTKLTESIKVEKDVFIINCKKHGKSLGPTSLLLGVLDLMQSRFMLFFTWALSDLKGSYPGMSIYDEGKRLFNMFTHCREIKGDVFFDIIKMWEPLLVGFVVSDPVNDLGFDTLYNELSHNISSHLSETGYSIVDLIPPNNELATLRMYLELSGMSKCFGHPCLDIVSGFREIQKHAFNLDPIDYDVMRQVLGVCISSFFFEYYRRHHCWPPMDHDRCDPSSKVYKILKAGKITEYLKSLEAMPQWSRIVAGKCLKFNFGLDPAEILKDTAISSPRYEWFTQYDNCAFRNLWGKNKPRTEGEMSERRVMLHYLLSDEQEQYQKFMEVMNNDFHEDRDCIATFCRKERELNRKGRIFVKQTYQQRAIQVLSEKNISEEYFPYVPEQTMDNSELALMKRQTQTTRALERELDIISLDLEKWCLHFRHSVVAPFGKHLDNVFGLSNVYEKSHLWFIKSLIFPNARLSPPDYDDRGMPIPGDHHYVGHLGGMEGMHQKKWTIITISAIKLVGLMLNLKIGIMGQGDNQVVILKYTKSQMDQKNTLRTQFLNALRETFSKLKMRLKLEETWYSSRLFEYGKVRFLGGKSVRGVTKKAHNVIADINTGVCSHYSCLSTVSTIGESIAKGDHDSLIGYFVACFETINYLDRKELISSSKRSELLSLLNYPSILGGIPVTNFACCTIRGIDDQLPYWLDFYRYISLVDPVLYKKITQRLPLKATGRPNLSRVVENIFGLNVDRFPSPDAEFRSIVDDFLRSKPNLNPEVAKLLDSAKPEDKDRLIAEISLMNPIYLPLAHELLRSSNYGIVSNMKSKFTSIQTICKVAQGQSEISFFDYCDLVAASCKEKITDFLAGYLTNNRDLELWRDLLISPCPTLYAKKLRLIHWGRELLGNTKPSPTHQVRITPTQDLAKSDLRRSLLMQLSPTFSRSAKNTVELPVGPFLPFLGSFTREKINRSDIDLLAATSLTRAVFQLGVLRGWATRLQCQYLVDIVDRLLAEKEIFITDCEESLEGSHTAANQIRAITEVEVGGNIFHRLHSAMERKSALINSLPDSVSHFSFSSNLLQYMSAGNRDFTIFYQLIYLYAASVFSLVRDGNTPLQTHWSAVLICPHCTLDITDIEITTPSSLTGGQGPSTLMPAVRMPTKLFDWNTWSWCRGIIEGRRLARLIRTVRYDFYVSTGAHDKDADNTDTTTSIVSMNTFRRLPVISVLIGILQGSGDLIQFIKQWRGKVCIHPPSVLKDYCSLVINSDRVWELATFFKRVVREHADGTNSKKLAKSLIQELFSLSGDHLDSICTLLTYSIFSDDHDGIMNNVERLKRVFKPKGVSHGLFQAIVTKRNIKMISKGLVEKTWALAQDKFTGVLLLKAGQVDNCEPVTDPSEYQSYFYSARKMVYEGDEGPTNNDLRHNCFRVLSSVSSSCSKLLELVSLYPRGKKIDCCVCTADGSGSMLALLLVLYSPTYYLHNTLVDPVGDARISPDLQGSSAIAAWRGRSIDLSDGAFQLGETDVSDFRFWENLRSYTIQCMPKILTMDAEHTEFDYDTYFDLLCGYLHWCTQVHEDNPTCYIKVYRTRITDELWTNLHNSGWFSHQPLSSGWNSKEYYMIWNSLPTTEAMCIARSEDPLLITSSTEKPWRCNNAVIDKLQIQLVEKISLDRNLGELVSYPLDKIFRGIGCRVRFCKMRNYSCLRELFELLSTNLRLNTELFSTVREGSLEKSIVMLAFLSVLYRGSVYLCPSGVTFSVIDYVVTKSGRSQNTIKVALKCSQENSRSIFKEYYEMSLRHPLMPCACTLDDKVQLGKYFNRYWDNELKHGMLVDIEFIS